MKFHSDFFPRGDPSVNGKTLSSLLGIRCAPRLETRFHFCTLNPRETENGSLTRFQRMFSSLWDFERAGYALPAEAHFPALAVWVKGKITVKVEPMNL